MVPSWMIEELQRRRRERERHQRSQLRIELPERGHEPPPSRPVGRPIVIELVGALSAG